LRCEIIATIYGYGKSVRPAAGAQARLMDAVMQQWSVVILHNIGKGQRRMAITVDVSTSIAVIENDSDSGG
jgi:hypothetical protein